MIEILDDLIERANILNLKIKYVALSEVLMKKLVQEAMSFAGTAFTIDTLSKYKDVKLAVKDIDGFQVSFIIDETDT